MGRSDILDRNSCDAKQLDVGLSNQWKWEWLERKVDDVFLSTFIRKLTTPGKAYCLWCDCELVYKSRGWKTFQSHVNTKKHQDQLKRRTNYVLPGQSAADKSQSSSLLAPMQSPYGIHPMFKGATKKEDVQPLVPLPDRIVTAQATVLGFVAEKALSFAIVPDLIQLAKSLARDEKALAGLHMDRTSASYKMRFGLAKTFENQLEHTLNDTHFSLNIDESTSESLKKVMAILVSYYCPVLKQVVVNHLSSISIIKVDSESLYNELVDVFVKRNLKWRNVVSILMDSCNVMRGSKSGLEVRIRNSVAPQLLDIDGDTCHHAHNAAKRFSKPFENFIERLFYDLYSDMKWSTDLRDYMQEMCLLLNLKFTMPPRFVSHRWLSAYDVSVDTLRMLDVYTVFYYGFLPNGDRTSDVRKVLKCIYEKQNVSEASKTQLAEIHRVLFSKKLTTDGQARKDRITSLMFFERKLMNLRLYANVFPLLKKYVLMFEMKEPMVHKLHDEQVQLLRDFFSCFIRAEVLSGTSDRKLQQLDLTDANQMMAKDMFLGIQNTKVVQEAKKSDNTVVTFLQKVKVAYQDCGQQLQKRMPVNNSLLTCLSALDPLALGHSVTVKHMLELKSYMKEVLSNDEENMYDLEVRRLHTGGKIVRPTGPYRLDTWWTENVFECGNYPTLSKIVKALLSCFHGPQVECSFNSMGDILDAKSSRLGIKTYSAIQSVRYLMKASGKTAVELFGKKDYIHEPVDGKLCQNIRSAYQSFKSEQDSAKSEIEQKKLSLGIQKHKLQSKRKAQEAAVVAAKRARQVFLEQKSKRDAAKTRLTALAKKRMASKKH